MADIKTFYLPDLGEGLPDATIVEWYVKVGDTIRLDDNLVSMETAKAVVDVPSPVSAPRSPRDWPRNASTTCSPRSNVSPVSTRTSRCSASK